MRLTKELPGLNKTAARITEMQIIEKAELVWKQEKRSCEGAKTFLSVNSKKTATERIKLPGTWGLLHQL